MLPNQLPQRPEAPEAADIGKRDRLGSGSLPGWQGPGKVAMSGR